jgi:ABC-type amino acid transport substrate-binding protein
MAGVSEFIDAIGNIEKYWQGFAKLCISSPILAVILLIPFTLAIGYISVSQLSEFFQRIRDWKKSKRGRIIIVSSVLITILISIIIVFSIRDAMQPKPVLSVDQHIVIGNDPLLKWTYNKDKNCMYELQSAEDESFKNPRLEETTDGELFQISRNVNDTRYWRVRAVLLKELHNEVGRATSEPLSPWSNVIKIEQYDNLYTRIKKKKEVKVYVSNSFNQGIFKFFSSTGRSTGLDIELSKQIVQRLPQKMDEVGKFNIIFTPIPWNDLLKTPKNGEADFIISAITKSSKRETEFSILFSDPYHFTTLSLIYFRGNNIDKPIRELLKGKSVGVQKGTTSEMVLSELNTDKDFQNKNHITIRTFNQNAEAMVKLRDPSSGVDYVVADTPFALGAKLHSHTEDGYMLDYKEFKNTDYSINTTTGDKTEPYALAVRSGEDKLIRHINEIIQDLKDEGRLAQMEEAAKIEYQRMIHEKINE